MTPDDEIVTELEGRWDLVTHRGCGGTFAHRTNGKLAERFPSFCPSCGKRMARPVVEKPSLIAMLDPLNLMREAKKVG